MVLELARTGKCYSFLFNFKKHNNTHTFPRCPSGWCIFFPRFVSRVQKQNSGVWCGMRLKRLEAAIMLWNEAEEVGGSDDVVETHFHFINPLIFCFICPRLAPRRVGKSDFPGQRPDQSCRAGDR